MQSIAAVVVSSVSRFKMKVEGETLPRSCALAQGRVRAGVVTTGGYHP